MADLAAPRLILKGVRMADYALNLITEQVQVSTAVMAAQSARPGALQDTSAWRVGGCGRPKGQGLDEGRHAGPPMVAEWSGVKEVHVVAPGVLFERPSSKSDRAVSAAAVESRENLLRRMSRSSI
jgi:hypothetical protein